MQPMSSVLFTFFFFVGVKLLGKGVMLVLVFIQLLLCSSFPHHWETESSMSQYWWQLTMVKQLSCVLLTPLKYKLSLMFMSTGLLPLEQLMIYGSWHCSILIHWIVFPCSGWLYRVLLVNYCAEVTRNTISH